MALLKVASWDEVAGDWNEIETETSYLHHTIRHEFNECASATVRIADPTGAKMQKYNVDTGAVFIGPGKLWIEDPDTVNLFYGRILKATYDYVNSQVVLYCEDWMNQLSDEVKTVDTREDLDGSGLREGTLTTDITYDKRCYYSAGGGEYAVTDADMDWAVDQFNGMAFIIPSSASGKITWSSGPSVEVVTRILGGALRVTDAPANGEENLWEQDLSYHEMDDGVNPGESNWYVEYRFWCPYDGATCWVDGPLDAWLDINYRILGQSTTDGYILIQAYDYSASAFVTFARRNVLRGAANTNRIFERIKVPATLIQDLSNAYLWIRITVGQPVPAGGANLTIDYIKLGFDMILTPYTTPLTITDTRRGADDASGGNYDSLVIGSTNPITIPVYEEMPYCITPYIYEYVNTLVTDADQLVTLDTSVETTDGAIARRFEEMTTKQIINELSLIDRAVYYVVLGDTTPTVIWKRTFSGDSATEWTDASVLSWDNVEYDGYSLYNEVHVYGTRIGDYQVFVDSADLSPDPGADSKDIYGTVSTIKTEQGIVSVIDAEQFAESFVTKHDDMKLYIGATLAGLSALRIGDSVNINSTTLGLTDEKYVITNWEYNSDSYRTRVKLCPRSDYGFPKQKDLGTAMRDNFEITDKLDKRIYAPQPATSD